MGQPIQLGLKIVVDKAAGSTDLQSFGADVRQVGADSKEAGVALATALSAATPAAASVAQAMAAVSETEAQATDRIRAMVAESVRQSTALNEASSSADLAAAAMRRASTETGNYAATVAAANAQMSQAAAPKVATISSDEALKYVAALQRQYDQVGKNAAELAEYEAKLRGANAATQAHAYAIVSDTEALKEQVAAEQRAGAAADAFLAKLKSQTEALGLNKVQLLQQQAAQLGVSESAAPMIARIEQAGKESKTAGGHMEGFSLKTAGAKREVLVLAHELSQGNFKQFGSSMMVLGEQTGAASLLMSGAGLVAAGFAASLALVTYGVIKGASEQRAMNGALLMTGDYAGVTSDKLNELAHSAVAAGGSIGEAKKVATELAASGKFTGDQIGYITEATVAWEHATGKSVEATIKEFETLAVQTNGSSARATEAISKATLKLDDTYHFLTESVYEQIRALEKEGDAKGASALATESFANVMHTRAEDMIKDAGEVAKAWNFVKETIGGAMDEVGNYGKKATPASEVTRLQGEIGRIDDGSYAASLGSKTGIISQDALAKKRAEDVTALNKAALELMAANKLAAEQAETAKTQSEGAHAASRVLMDDQKLEKKGWSELDLAIRAYGEDLAKVAAANPDSPLLTQDSVNAHMAALTKAHTPAAKKTPGADDRKAELDGLMQAAQAQVNVEKAKYQQLDSLAQLYHSAGDASDGEFYAKRLSNLEGSRTAELDGYDKELTALHGFNAKTAVERQDNLNKIKQVEAARASAEQGYADKRQLLTTAETLRQKAVVEASDEAMNKSIADLAAEAQKQEDANTGRETSRASIERQTVARLDAAIASTKQLQAEQALKGATADEIAQSTRVLQFLEDQRAGHERLSAALAKGDSLKFDTKSWAEAEKTTKAFAQSMADSFGNVGTSIGKMSTALFDFQKTQKDIAADLAHNKGIANGDQVKVIEAETKANHDNAQAQVKQYGDMANAASGFFKKNSTGYKALHGAEETFRAFQLALSLQTMVQQLTAVTTVTAATVTGEATKAAASTVSAGVQVASNMAVGTSAAPAGVAQQAMGDPYTAFFRMAAMAAVMVGLGFAISGGGGGQDVGKERQAAAGRGSVLGHSKAKTDSIASSLTLIADNSDIELSHTAGMLTSLRNIENSISGLGSLLVSGTDVTSLAGSVAATSSGGFFGGIISSIFGGKTSVDDTGVVINKLTVADVEAGALTSQSYVDTTKSGGWFSSDSHNTTTSALGDQVDDQFSKVITGIAASVSTAADLLGVGGDEFEARLDSFEVDIGKISLKDLTGEEIQDQLEAVFSKVGDDLANQSVSGLLQFQKVGEGALETLTRIATDYANVDSILASVGMTFNGVGMDSVAARERLIDLAGSVDDLASQTSSFADDFLTDAERLAPVKKYVDDFMASIGQAGVTSHDAFKNLVLGIDTSTEAGAKLYTSLLSVESAFNQVYPSTEKAAATATELAESRADQETQLYELTHTSLENLTRERELELAAMDASLQPMQALIYAAQDASDLAKSRADQETTLFNLTHTAAEQLTRQRQLELAAMDASLQPMQELIYIMQDQSTAVTDARSALKSSYDAEATTLKSLITLKQNEAAATLKQMDALKLGELSTLSPEQKMEEARKQFDAATGDDKDTAASAYLTALQTYYGSTDGYSQGYAYVQSQLAIQAASASSAATIAEQQLDALDKQVDGLITLDDSVLSVKDAIDNLTDALTAQNTSTGTAGTQTDALEATYEALLNRHSDAGGYEYYKKAMAAGSTLSDIINDIINSDEYTKVHGSHLNGLSNVPFNGYIAELHKDEAVLTAQENAIWKALNDPQGATSQPSRGSDALKPLTDAMARQATAMEQQNLVLQQVLTAVEKSTDVLLAGDKQNIRELNQSLTTLISKALA